MNIAKAGASVRVLYTICLENGARFNPLHSGDSLEFTIGRDSVLPGFEKAVLGMSPGEIRRAKVPAAEAYGPHRPEKIFTLDRSDVLPQIEPLSVGDVVRVASADEGEFFAVIREINGSKILLDANHPLCGQDITFEIHLVELAAPDSNPAVTTGGIEAARRRNGAVPAASGR